MSPDRLATKVNTMYHLAALMFVVLIGGMVALVATGNSTDSIERIAGPLLTAVVITGVLGKTSQDTEERLDEVAKAAAEHAQAIHDQTERTADRLEELADPGEDYSPRYAAGPQRAGEDARRAGARVAPDPDDPDDPAGGPLTRDGDTDDPAE